MVLPIHAAEALPLDEVLPVSSLQIDQRQPLFNPCDRRVLVHDFFSWFEYEWQQPVIRTHAPLASNVFTLAPSLREMLNEQKMYTFPDLSLLSDHTHAKIKADLKTHNIRARDRSSPQGRYRNRVNLYLGQDLIPVVEKWEWDTLCQVIDTFWLRFVQEPCGDCNHCRAEPNVASFYCQRNHSNPILLYRHTFFALLQALQIYGDGVWWSHEHEAVLEGKPGSITERSKLVLIYLLDRHLLTLSFEEMFLISFRGCARKDIYIDHLRPYRHRRPEEYATLLRAMDMVPYNKKKQYDILAIIALLILLKYGFPGLAELGRKLEPEEVQQAIWEKRLLTPHVAYGIYLTLPLSDDLRVGHIVLDDIRRYFWKYSAGIVRVTNQPYWSHGPYGWQASHIFALERLLRANIWDNGCPLLPPRPEVALSRVNPYTFRFRAGQEEGGAFDSLPPKLRKAIQIFVDYRYQQQQIVINTITGDLRGLFSFFAWARDHVDLEMYASWDRERMRAIVNAFLSEKRSSVKNETLYHTINQLSVFFETLAELRLPHPSDYAVLPTLLPAYSKAVRAIPLEEVFDRLFRDGVCQLGYDPFARLALTIQYFCGTRVTETCDLPLFCIVEDINSQFAYLVIPRGKTKQERSFPIAPIGMGLLLEYMDQVVRLQIDPEGKLRNFSRTNVRYLEAEPEKAYHWDYLFDRQYSSSGRTWRQSVLTPSRVRYALEEAILLAAKQNPVGFFRHETYSPICRITREPGQICGFLALRDEITVCPICGKTLPGRQGYRCHHQLTQAFTCNGVTENGSYFCPRCDAPLAEVVSITSHAFRHNSVTRAHRYGVPLAENMLLHGHQTLPMHLRYLHLLPEDQQAVVHQIFSEKIFRDMRLDSNYAPGQVIEKGVAYTATVEQLIGLTLRRELKRRTAGLWGGFWTGALAEEGAVPPLRQKAEILLTEEAYHHAVAQYRYEALGLAVSEVALEYGTKGKYKATIAPFLERREMERVVSSYMSYVQQGYLNTARGVRLIEADIKAQRLFLDELVEMLRPWWQHLSNINNLVNALFSGEDIFQKAGAYDAIEQE